MTIEPSPPYQEVRAVVEASGFFTTTQPLSDEGGTRLVCASAGGRGGLGGISFWVTFQSAAWFIASWAPHIYRIPNSARAADVVVAAIRASLDHPKRQYHDIAQVVQTRFGLCEITQDDFDRICATDTA